MTFSLVTWLFLELRDLAYETIDVNYVTWLTRDSAYEIFPSLPLHVVTHVLYNYSASECLHKDYSRSKHFPTVYVQHSPITSSGSKELLKEEIKMN